VRAVDVVVHGRVQGVFFRDSTRTQARAAGVRGWVRNRPDGTVEAHLEGEAEAVDRVLAWMHEGPPHARVEQVVHEDATVQDPPGFEVR
jgi:acylphosphatase